MLLKQNKQSGYLLVLVLVFSGIFLTILTAFIGFVYSQNRVVIQRVNFEQAGNVAEAGLNYYRWFLSHYPDDVTNGTGAPGPYVHEYHDPEGDAIGEFSLDIASANYCGDVSSITVTSTGYTYANPDVKRTISASYRRPTVADYSFILNADVWVGPSRTITGPYHSNGGIRMDGRNNSTVSSSRETWNCLTSFGCNPQRNNVAGVYTLNGYSNSSLFRYPATSIDFNSITVDLASIKGYAQNRGGTFIPMTPSGWNDEGLHLRFDGDRVIVGRVFDTYRYRGESTEHGLAYENNIIKTYKSHQTHTINPDCPIIYTEADKVWIEGNISGKVTLAVHNSRTDINPSIIIQGNITYDDPLTSGFLAIAEEDILLGVNVPNNLYLNGIFIAQNGRYGRNHYTSGYLPSGFSTYVSRDSENFNGTIVSRGRVGTEWVSGTSHSSGFRNRYNTFDRNLAENPPALTPRVSDVYELFDWNEHR